MKLRNSMIVSTAGHLVILLLLLLLGSGAWSKQKGNTNPRGDQNEYIMPKQGDSSLTEIETVEIKEPLSKKLKRVPHVDDKCSDYYGGIGVTHGIDSVVREVPENYPAYRAGIRPGDILISDTEALRGEIGSEVIVTYQNNEGTHTITLVRDKICLIKDRIAW